MIASLGYEAVLLEGLPKNEKVTFYYINRK